MRTCILETTYCEHAQKSYELRSRFLLQWFATSVRLEELLRIPPNHAYEQGDPVRLHIGSDGSGMRVR
jgi:hypothetical protein